MTIKGEAKRLESSFSSINLSFSLRLRYPLRIHPIIHPIIHHPDTKMETSELGHEEEEEQQVTKQEDEGEGEEVVISNEMEASAGNSSLAARSDREVLVARSALSSRPGNKNQTKSALIRSKSAPIRSRNTMLLRNSPTGCVMSIGREEASALCSGDSLVNEVRDFKKISQGRRRQGSALHRNSQRSQRLMSLNTKEKIRRLLVNQFERKGKESRDLEEGGASGSELAILKETEPFLYYQVKNEDSRKRDSAKLIEINKLIEPYCVASGQSLHAQKFPLEVRLQKVTYTVADETSAAAQGSSPQQIQTVFNTSVFYSAYTWLRRLVRCQETTSNKTVQVPRKSVLEDINLVIQPGKHYLLLGPPGSGKSTLLKTIAGLIRHDEDDDVGKMSAGNIHASLQGEILYNGRSLKNADGIHIDNAFGYIDQLDKHAARLTVGETLEFAFQCKAGGSMLRDVRKGINQEQLDVIQTAEKEGLPRKIMLNILGLSDVEDTFVGDATVRGISGGQRRRVTVGEMLMSRTPVVCGDEISTGLDAASTYDMVDVLFNLDPSNHFSRVFALLQPSPETVSLFDEVIVLAEGRIIYAGPIEEVEDYFAELGFKSPEFVDIADFLQMVSTDDREDLYDPPANVKSRSHLTGAPTVADLAKTFRKSYHGTRIQELLETKSQYGWDKVEKRSVFGKVDKFLRKSASFGDMTKISVPARTLAFSKFEAVKHKYANHWCRSTILITRRFLTLWVRDKAVLAFSVVRNVINGASIGGVFINAEDFISIEGALFQTGIFVLLGSLQTSSGLVSDRVLFYKHADANFYSAWPYVCGRTLSQIPQTLLMDTIVSGTVLYFMIGFADRGSASNFFTFLLILFLFSLVMNQQLAVFASFASEARLPVYTACTLFVAILFSGFILPFSTIPKYFVWLYWWNPFAWAYRAFILNEAYSGRWPDPEALLAASGFVKHDGSSFGEKWIWWGVLYMLVYFLICCIFTALGLTYSWNTGDHVAPQETHQHKKSGKNETNTERRIEIPFKPLTLSFQDLCYEVSASTSKEKLLLLRNANGIFRPGRMCALMGSSGAGKTTLMDVIALRKRSGNITGDVRLNGWPQDSISFRRSSGYVEQFDVQSPELTVRETVIFSARLRLDPLVVKTDEEKLAFVDQILEDVELSTLGNSLVGFDDGLGLSFEQKKRLSIAVELAASPSVLFLDEPTSGLDARSALLVVRLLRRVSDTGRTVVATIHQPSSAVFGMFDDLLLLKTGGEVVFHGALGNNYRGLIDYFETRGATPIELGDNPANWMLRVLMEEGMGNLDQIWKESPVFAALQEELRVESPSADAKIEYKSEFATGRLTRQRLTNRRLRTIYWRSPVYNLGRLMVSLVIAFSLVVVFVTERKKLVYTEPEIRARISCIFFSNIIVGIMSIISILPVMTWIRDMYYRHRNTGMYDSASIGVALGSAEEPFICLSTLLFCVVFLTTSGLGAGAPGFQSYFVFWGFFTFNAALFSFFGQLFVCATKSIKSALVLVGVYIGFNNMFAGLIIRPQEMTTGIYAVTYYLTPGHYVFEGEVTSIMTNSIRSVQASVGSSYHEWLVDAGTCVLDQKVSCIGSQHEFILYFFGGEYVEEHISRNAYILGGVLVLVRLFTYLALKYIRFSD